MKKKIKKCVLLFSILLLSGCEFVAPDTSKAISENYQLKEQVKQSILLERIAKALERIAEK